MPRGRSLHIAVNSLDPAEYCYKDYPLLRYNVFVREDGTLKKIEMGGNEFVLGWIGPLGYPPLPGSDGCEIDADAMAKIAEEQSFDPIVVLKTTEATAERVKAEIEKAADELKAGDFFFVTYSGHGAHVGDVSGDEDEGYDETWCLYDRMLLDDEQAFLYSKFDPGVRIFVFLDSCHSGTATRAEPEDDEEEEDEDSEVRSLPRGLDKSIYEYGGNTAKYDKIQKDLMAKIEKARAENPRVGRRNFNVVSISACSDGQKARGSKGKGGWLSNAVTKAFAAKPANYLEFHQRIGKIIEDDHPDPKKRQDPQLDHGPWKSRVFREILKKGRPLSDEDWASTFDELEVERQQINKRRERNQDHKQSPLPPLTDDEKHALKDLHTFLCSPPLVIE